MYSIKNLCAKMLAIMLATKQGQDILQNIVRGTNYLMGIGAGAVAEFSGEVGVVAELTRYGKPPYIVFDVGANKGQFLRIVLDNIDITHTEIHCFEPSFVSFRILSERFSAYNGVRLNNFGLGNQKCEATLYYDKPDSGLASLSKRRLNHFGINNCQYETVQIDTVDAYCESNDILEIALLKIDVEGHELDVLRGAERMLAKRSIKTIAFEFGGCNIDTRTFLQDFWYFFEYYSLELLRVTPSGYLYPIKTYEETLEQMVTTNYVARLTC